MEQRTPEEPRPDKYARARSEEEPGAHSGGESPARDRVVPGSASATEGYRTKGGTAHGEALTGVEATRRDPEDEEPAGPDGTGGETARRTPPDRE